MRLWLSTEIRNDLEPSHPSADPVRWDTAHVSRGWTVGLPKTAYPMPTILILLDEVGILKYRGFNAV